MAGRGTNVALAAALALALLTGALAFAAGTGEGAWVIAAHGIVGAAIVVLTPWKSVIVRRGMARRRRGVLTSVALGVSVIVCLLAGVSHATGIALSLGSVTAMQVHVGAALIATPLALGHIRNRPARPRRSDASRRQLLRVGGLFAAASVAYLAVEGATRALALPGRRRRFTGSYEKGSDEPDAMPVTQWLNDSVPEIDGDRWRLSIVAGDTARSLSYATIASFDDRVRATIDCTGGWWSMQDWEGVWLTRLVPEAAGRSIVVISHTGYRRRFPASDAPHLLLATRMSGSALDPGHGAPARLVAPGRRGFWWVKWVAAVEVDDTPWWVQSPFPLT